MSENLEPVNGAVQHGHVVEAGDHTLKFLFLAGPTAVGKTALAVEAAQRLGAEIVNADAYQLYRGLPILTAKPSAAELRAAPHHLVGTVPLHQEISAAFYGRLATEKILGLQAAGRPVLVTGGGGFYLKVLTHGLSNLPASDPALRAEIEALEPEEAREQLLRLEPGAGEFLDPQNPRRVQRALILLRQTGRTLAELRAEQNRPQRRGARGIVLTRDRAELYDRVNARTHAMFDAGVEQEVEQTLREAHRTGRPLSRTAGQAIGLREIQALLRGEARREEVIEKIQVTTRRYAKRQETWFRNQIQARTINLSETPAPEVINILEHPQNQP